MTRERLSCFNSSERASTDNQFVQALILCLLNDVKFTIAVNVFLNFHQCFPIVDPRHTSTIYRPRCIFQLTTMTSSSIMIAVVVLTAVAAAQQFPWDCRRDGVDCNVCVNLGACGWCTYSGRCESGNATGSDAGCTAPYWIASEASCPATPAPTTYDCHSNVDCDSCTAAASCGWCTFSGRCEQGNATGSFAGCLAPYWSWTASQCASDAGHSRA